MLIPTGAGWNFESILLPRPEHAPPGTRLHSESTTTRAFATASPSFRGPTIVLNFHGGFTRAEGGREGYFYCGHGPDAAERLRANSSGEFCACDFRPWRISKIPRDP